MRHETRSSPSRFVYDHMPVRTNRHWWWLPLAIVLVSLGALIMMTGVAPREFFSALFASLTEEEPLTSALMGAAVLLALLAHLTLRSRIRHTALDIDQTGLRCRPPGTGIHLFLQDPRHHSWQLPHDRIRHAELIPPSANADKLQGLTLWRLKLHSDTGSRELAPYLWIRRDGPDHRLHGWQLVLPRRKQTIRKMVQDSPLMQALEERGIPIENSEAPLSPLAASIAGGYDLGRHPGMLVQLGLFFSAAGYAVVDGLLLRPYEALELPPLAPFAGMLIAGACLAGALGRGAPRLERAAVGALCTAALTAAVYPGLLRYNAASAPAPVVHEYSMSQPGIFSPGDTGLPRLDLRHLDLGDYWKALKPPIHEFRLYRGEVGIWQLDRGKLFERTREFYASRQ